MGTVYYGQAIGRALSDEMKKDENVVVWGEDVAVAGNVPVEAVVNAAKVLMKVMSEVLS